MFLSGLAITLFCYIFLVTFGKGDPMASIMFFTDLPSLLAIVGPLAAVLTATQSFKVFYAGLRAVAFPKTEISEEMRGRAASLFRLLSKTAAMAAAISTLIGFLFILGEMDFEDVAIASKIARNIYVSLISPLYALLLIVAVFEPVVFILKKRHPGRR